VPRPLRPATFDTVATEMSDELQPTWVVRSFVVWSEYVPVATNGCVVPAAIDGFVGVTAIETSLASLPCDFEPQPESTASNAIPHGRSHRRAVVRPARTDTGSEARRFEFMAGKSWGRLTSRGRPRGR